jgi:Secretion system C-terminal sorting domain/FG-GAP repeat
MKKSLLLLFLFPILSFSQIQIGNDIDGEAAGDYSGNSISLSSDGSVLAIGAYTNDGNGINSGQVRVYKNISGIWTQVGADINGNVAEHGCGYSVSLSSDGSVVAIGVLYVNCFSCQNDSGYVSVYHNISGVWTQLGQDIRISYQNFRFGYSVSLSADGNKVAIGAPRNDVNSNNSGSVTVYNFSFGYWRFVTSFYGEAALDESGTSVSLSANGDFVAIGAPNNNNSTGHVRVYKVISGSAFIVGSDIEGLIYGDLSGSSVSLSSDGSVLAIGAIGNDVNGNCSGHVRVYRNISNVWTKIGDDINGEAANDYSGNSVSLSSDGNIVAIGAYFNGGNGNYSGQVRIYKNISGIWTKIGFDIDGEAQSDQSGCSVSLSSNGTIVAIGAKANDGNGNESGHVRVYDLTTALLAKNSFEQVNFSIFPNPVKDIVTIQLKEGLLIEKATIYNSLGQVVITENSNLISVNYLAKGIYFLEVITNKGKATKTIVVE